MEPVDLVQLEAVLGEAAEHGAPAAGAEVDGDAKRSAPHLAGSIPRIGRYPRVRRS
jgi:hypothetical protein